MKKAYLLTWNPKNWNWSDYKEKVKVIKEGKTFIESWTSSSKQPKVGDQVFLLKTQWESLVTDKLKELHTMHLITMLRKPKKD